MKAVDVVEVYATKISYNLFLLKVYKNLLTVEKVRCSEFQKSLNQ